MTALFLLPVYILVNIAGLRFLLSWLRSLHSVFSSRPVMWCFGTVYTLLALTPALTAVTHGNVKRIASVISNHWLLPLCYYLGLLALFGLILLISNRIKKQPLLSPAQPMMMRIGGLIIVAVVLISSVYGSVHANQIKTTHYDVEIQKETSIDGLKIALVADLHLGINNGLEKVQKMQSIIEQAQPDLIIYAGDIFDNDYDTIADPEAIIDVLKNLDSTYGSYACWGNHDMAETILAGFTFSSGDEDVHSDPRMDAFLEEAGITLLTDEVTLVGDAFYLAGRRDASEEHKNGTVRLSADELLSSADQNLPIIVIDHQPKELQELADAGADLTLSGHTHDGQTFPSNLTVKLLWENPCGMIQKDSMTDIVTSGLGVWGPAMRIGTDAEVVIIDAAFTS